MLVAIMLGNENGNEYQVYACDTNRDDIIDLQDVVMLMQWILEIDIDSLILYLTLVLIKMVM